MAENVLGLVLLFTDHLLQYSKISPENRVYCVNVTKQVSIQINKNRSRIRAALD